MILEGVVESGKVFYLNMKLPMIFKVPYSTPCYSPLCEVPMACIKYALNISFRIISFYLGLSKSFLFEIIWELMKNLAKRL